MFIIWGSRHSSKVLAEIGHFNCSHCHNTVPFNFVKHIDWFTLYFVPIIPMHTEYWAECPICSYGLEIEKKRAKEILIELKEEKQKYEAQ